MNVLITGGAGFVGSSICKLLRNTDKGNNVWAFDNLRRRGSERNIEILRSHGVNFVHGDSRATRDLLDIPTRFDVIIDAAAEPSIHGGSNAATTRYVLETNLLGTINTLERAIKDRAFFIFLSTSRVYSIDALRSIALREKGSRFELSDVSQPDGVSLKGINESFACMGKGPRTLYGTTKLASEMLIEEYVELYDLKAVINRCGVIAGPGQFGKTDQGVFTHWVAAHIFGKDLAYTGFGGRGLQVRDLLHPVDLYKLIANQISQSSKLTGEVFNAGGGFNGAVSLSEYTDMCSTATGSTLSEIKQDDRTHANDAPWIIMDSRKAYQRFGWEARITPSQIVKEIHDWIAENKEELYTIFN